MERAGLYFKDEPKKHQEMLEDFRAGKFILFKIGGEEAILKKTGPRSAAFILLREPPENFERVFGLQADSISFRLWGVEEGTFSVEPFGKGSFILSCL